MSSKMRSGAEGRPATGPRAARLLVVMGFVAVSACTPQYRNHGYLPTETDLATISVGVDTRDTVVAAIGAPTVDGVLNDSSMYYVESKFRHLGPLAPQEIERQVLAVSFNAAGVLTNIERFGLSDGRVITLSRRVTDDNVRDTTFIRQLLGNLGNFDPTALIGAPQG
jgi:outer membrane protein assembly factor BamE (lipoprotein component of BamABCDE complex)